MLTYLLTACSTVLLEKLNVSQQHKKSLAFYETQQFITAVTFNTIQAQYMEIQQDIMFLVSLSP